MQMFNLHLISDATCETVVAVARSALGYFPSLQAEEYVWSLIRTQKQIDSIMDKIDITGKNFIMFTLNEDSLRAHLRNRCIELEIPCISVLSQVIREISSYLSVKGHSVHKDISGLGEDYYSRINAITYTIAHDDGQNLWDIEEADIVLIGVSRSSKSPTSMYLAYRGYKVINIPYVHNIPLPINLEQLRNKLVVGLTIDVNRLLKVRENRLIAMQDTKNIDYVSPDKVHEEIEAAKRLCIDNGWPIIDVTQRSVEEIAAMILHYLQHRNLCSKQNKH